MDERYIKLSDAKNAIADYIAEQTVSKYGSLEACREARFGAEGAMKELDYVPTADVVPKNESEFDSIPVEVAQVLKDKAVEKAKAEVARTFRKRMNEKMGKHTHLLGKEYVQRIMREVEKELTGEKDA